MKITTKDGKSKWNLWLTSHSFSFSMFLNVFSSHFKHLETLVDRILKRAESSGRNDDNIETLKKRLNTFNEQTMPVINRYDKEGRCRKIDGSGEVDAIFKNVLNVLDVKL